jgi:adenylate kinase
MISLDMEQTPSKDKRRRNANPNNKQRLLQPRAVKYNIMLAMLYYMIMDRHEVIKDTKDS